MGRTISFVKGKGSLRHNNRDFIASNIDEGRISWNKYYIRKPLKMAYEKIFGDAVAEYNAKQKRSDRKIDDYLTKIKNSGNREKMFYENVVQIGKRDDTGVLDANGNLSDAAKQVKEVLDEYVRTFQERNPNLILFNAVLHMDEATPHLHLDYIPVAHGYKKGLRTRNSLTKAMQEMGIAPANSKTDTETMHWQERERAYLTDLCRDRGIEIEVLGVQRDSYSIPEYKQAMQEKEAAEAEMEILKSEKAEASEIMAVMDDKIEQGNIEIEEQREILEDINVKIAEAEKKIKAKETALNRIIDAGEPAKKEIEKIKAKATVSTPLFGGESTVRIPKSVFDDMLDRYRVAVVLENLNKQYEKMLDIKGKKIDSLNAEVRKWRDRYKQCTEFIESRDLLAAFKEFIRPRSIYEKLTSRKERLMELDQRDRMKQINGKRSSVAI